jgi:hypothetical protein
MSGWNPEEQRQQAIVRRLELVGDGPVAYFTDACHLMQGELELDAKSHLVSHLLATTLKIGSPVFETAPFNHSGTPPGLGPGADSTVGDQRQGRGA